MKTYKTLEHLKQRCILNYWRNANNIWNDEGIKIRGKIFRQMEYGNVGYNFRGNCYIIFRNTGKKGRQLTYANREKFSDRDSFIRIEYKLYNSDKFSFVNLEKY